MSTVGAGWAAGFSARRDIARRMTVDSVTAGTRMPITAAMKLTSCPGSKNVFVSTAVTDHARCRIYSGSGDGYITDMSGNRY